MRLQEFLINEEKDIGEIIQILKKDCSKFLRERGKPTNFLYRGTTRPVKDIVKIIPRKDRKPLDTPQELSDLMDKLFMPKFGWRPRSSGVFAIGDKDAAEEYGEVSLFFPIGDYKYIWSPKITDFYFSLLMSGFTEREGGKRVSVYDPGNKIHVEKIKKMVNSYINSKLSSAVESGNEIMFMCKSYYLVNRNLKSELKEELNK